MAAPPARKNIAINARNNMRPSIRLSSPDALSAILYGGQSSGSTPRWSIRAWSPLDRPGQLCYARCMSQSASPPLVAVLNGPNMNMLGLRQPHLYGSATLDDVEQLCAETADQLGLAIDFRQTNGEGELVSWVQECRGRAQGIVINPAGYTTTSIALMDALLATDLPIIEVHVTNIHRREEFRQHSYVSKAAVGVICGLGVRGYALALTAMADILLEADA
jgi:3-dehydroquinate dehydratase-2